MLNCSLLHFRWKSFGKHYYFTEQMEEKLKYTYSSQSFIESEMTEAEITAGYITNTGTLSQHYSK